MRSKSIRCVLLVAWLSIAAAVSAPAAAAPGDAGWQPAWWQGAVSWLAERLPFAGWLTAASEVAETTPPEDDGSTPTVDLLDPQGTQNQSGNENDKDGDGLPDADPDG